MRPSAMRPLAILTLALTLLPVLASAEIRVTNAWTRATPPGLDKGAGYLTIHNDSSRDVRLTGAASQTTSTIEIHRSTERDGQMMMEHIEQGLPIAAGKSVTLEPMGYHLMLMGLEAPLKAGERIPLTLEFNKHEDVSTSLEVHPPGHDGHGMDHTQ